MAKVISQLSGINGRTNLFYNFICEHCGKDTGKQKITFSISRADPDELKIDNGSYILPQDYYEKMINKVKVSLNERISTFKEFVNNGEYQKCIDSGGYLNGKCTSCGKYQSWMSKGSSKYLWGYPLLFGCIIIALFGFLVIFKKDADEFMNKYGVYVILIILIGSIIGFIFGLLKYRKIKNDIKRIKQKRLPVIVWPDENQFEISQTMVKIN